MEAAGTRLNLVMLDACRNNPFGGRGLRAIDAGLAQMRAPEGTLISFATQPGNVAQDGDDGHSPYSRALARTIQRPGLGVFDTLNQVGLTVKKATGGEQQPWVSSSPIDGGFYFAGVAKADEPPPASATLSDAAVKLQSNPAPALPQRVEASNAAPAAQDDTAKAVPRDSKNAEVAMVSPVQTLPPASPEQGNADRGVAIYNGRWGASVSGSCPHVSSGVLVVHDGLIRGAIFGASGTGRIYADGHVSAQFVSLGVIHGRAAGRMTSATSGGGSWSDSVGCSGGWSMSR